MNFPPENSVYLSQSPRKLTHHDGPFQVPAGQKQPHPARQEQGQGAEEAEKNARHDRRGRNGYHGKGQGDYRAAEEEGGAFFRNFVLCVKNLKYFFKFLGRGKD